MNTKPIPFSPPMVRALLRDTDPKTQTRRGLKLRGYKGFSEFQRSTTHGYDWQFRRADMAWCDVTNARLLDLLPYQVGDLCYVTEPWRTDIAVDNVPPSEIGTGRGVKYETDGACSIQYGNDMPEKWGRLRPGMFMCRWMSRITLRVTAVKVEKLQDISSADAEAEGVERLSECRWRDYLDIDPDHYINAVASFASLWTSINGPGSWDANPFVAAYTFELANR